MPILYTSCDMPRSVWSTSMQWESKQSSKMWWTWLWMQIYQVCTVVAQRISTAWARFDSYLLLTFARHLSSPSSSILAIYTPTHPPIHSYCEAFEAGFTYNECCQDIQSNQVACQSIFEPVNCGPVERQCPYVNQCEASKYIVETSIEYVNPIISTYT